MNRKTLVFCLLLIFCATELAMAWPRVLRRRRSSNSYDSTSFGQVYDDEYPNLPASSAIYDWGEIAKIDAADYIPIVLDEPISGDLEVKLTCLSNSAETLTIQAKLENGRTELRHESIKPGTMYRLCASIDGKQRIVGPYFTATSGDSIEARGRRQIVIRYFEQYWRKENGWTYHDANCEAGYRWAVRPYAAVPRYDYNSHNLISFDKEGMIHGDKCANSSHVWMALAYDEHEGKIWCLDSNFNSTIMVILRQSAGWSVAHLTADHFREIESG
ncbi:MAG: hypothetical protein GX575_07985 [Candidatus Anammoximicrobium sp.]|nr:hypothetical protein [Candidatus Anammoximicrobium sp.]